MNLDVYRGYTAYSLIKTLKIPLKKGAFCCICNISSFLKIGEGKVGQWEEAVGILACGWVSGTDMGSAHLTEAENISLSARQ